jgi:hypothetical protein
MCNTAAAAVTMMPHAAGEDVSNQFRSLTGVGGLQNRITYGRARMMATSMLRRKAVVAMVSKRGRVTRLDAKASVIKRRLKK